MKKLFLYLSLIVCSAVSMAQSPIGDSLPVKQAVANAANVQMLTNAATFKGSLQFGYFADTTAANASPLKCKFYPNAFITTAKGTYKRNNTATQWVLMATINDIVTVYGCYVLLNGGIVSWSGSGLVMDVTNAHYIIGCNPYSSPTSQVTLSAADPSNPRIDVIAVDVNGQVVVIQGTAGATSKTFPASWVGFNILFVRNNITQSTVNQGASYYSWDKNTATLNLLGTPSSPAQLTELFQIYPVS